LRAAILAAAALAGAGVWLASSDTSAHELDRARTLIQQGRAPTAPQVQDSVRKALRRDLTQPAALEMRALAFERNGDRESAARLYGLSDRIGRRSLATRLWLVQDAVQRGDVKGALANMDVALRTSSAAPTFVFPAMVHGLDDPELVEPIAALVNRPSDWREGFLIYATDNADSSSAAALLLNARTVPFIVKDELDRKLVARLVDDGKFALAWQLDAAFDPRPPGTGLVEDGSFNDPAVRYPFGWGLNDKGEIGASRETENGRPVLAYHANVAESGQVAAQVLMLKPGTYALDLLAGRSAPTEVPPVWTLACAGETRILAMLAMPPGHAHAGVRFSVPPNCVAQWLVLTIRPALTPQSGSVENLTISAR